MSHNLTLSKTVKSSKKGESPVTQECPLWQTPTTLTNSCSPFLGDRWKVFDRYQSWARETRFVHVSPYDTQAREDVEASLQDHLSAVRQALEDGYEWSWE